MPDAWKAAVTEEEWPKVQNVLSRGGRFWPIEDSQTAEGRSAFAAEYLAYVYSELKATNINPYSGVRPSGALKWVPEDLCDRLLLTDTFNETDFPFRSTNYKPRFRSVSMQANNPIMRDLCAKNFLEINRDDAARLGIADGDEVRVPSRRAESVSAAPRRNTSARSSSRLPSLRAPALRSLLAPARGGRCCRWRWSCC